MSRTKLTHPSKFPDSAAPNLESITYLYSLTRTHHRSLSNILQDSIFSHAGLAGLNDHPALEVLDKLALALAERGEVDGLAEVEQVRHRLNQHSLNNQDLKPEVVHEPLASTSNKTLPESLVKADVLEPARRSTAEEVPFRLGSLKGSLDVITNHPVHLKDPYTRQDLLEESAYDAARWQKLHEQDQLNKLGLGTDVRLKGNPLQRFMSQWLEALVPFLEKELSRKGKRLPYVSEDIVALLSLMDVRKLAFITIVEVLRNAGNTTLADGIKATRAIIILGRAVEDEYGAEAWKILHPELYDRLISSPARKPQLAVRKFMVEEGIAEGAANVARQEGYGDMADELVHIQDANERTAKLSARKRAMPWSQKMRAKVGGFLIQSLLQTAKVQRTEKLEDDQVITETQPAFYQSYQFIRGQKVGVLKVNPAISKRLDKDNVGHEIFPRYLPMLVPPKPWTSWNSGGYRIHPTEILRINDCPEQLMYAKLGSEQGHLDRVFTALDVLGSTPWRINKAVFEVISQVWNSGEALADIPVNNADFSIPDPVMPSEAEMKDPTIRQSFRLAMKQVRLTRAKAHSQRCDLNYKLEIARAVSFYVPRPNLLR